MSLEKTPRMARPLVSLSLLAVQFACMIALLATGPWWANAPGWLLVEVLGLALGAWAILVMGPTRTNAVPDPRPDARLVERGPYAVIRHPMYTAVLLVFGALAFDAPSPLRLALWGVLLVDLLVKLHYEERLLDARLPGYAAYRARTKRLVPGLY